MRPAVSRVRESKPGRKSRARGAIAVMTAIILPLLFGFAAFVVDLGRMYVYKAEIQTAMDGCALAAVASLNGSADPTIFDTARAQGLTTMDQSKVGNAARAATTVNRLHFQRDNFVLANVAVEYSTAMGGPWVAATSASYGGITPQTARYVRCTYVDEDNPLFFTPILKVLAPSAPLQLDVAAYAVAALRPSQSTCAFPVAVCAANTNPTASPPFGLAIGTRLTAVEGPGTPYGTGNFGWLDFTPPNGGAPELRNQITGSGTCAVQAGDFVGNPGVVSSLEAAWNTRFGLYQNGGGTNININAAPPDFSGYAYPSGNNNYPDYVTRAASRAPFQGTVPNNVQTTNTTGHGQYGQKRRLVTGAIVDCNVWNLPGGGSTNPQVLDFACIFLVSPVETTGGGGGGGGGSSWSGVAPSMAIEYRGVANDPGTPCASSGLAGGVYGTPVPTLVQ